MGKDDNNAGKNYKNWKKLEFKYRFAGASDNMFDIILTLSGILFLYWRFCFFIGHFIYDLAFSMLKVSVFVA